MVEYKQRLIAGIHMKKEDLLQYVKANNIEVVLTPYLIKYGELSSSSYIYGYGYEDGKWQVYHNNDRGGHIIIDKFNTESDAIDFLYDLLKAKYEWATRGR